MPRQVLRSGARSVLVDRWSRWWLLAIFALHGSLHGALVAQREPRLEVNGPSPEVVRLGEVASLELRVFDPVGRPKRPVLPAVDGLESAVGRATPVSFRTSNGLRVQQGVLWTWPVRLRPSRAGEFVIPPFEVDLGSRRQRVGPLRLQCITDARGADFSFFDVQVEPQRVYVNEPFDVRMEFGIDERLRTLTRNVRTRTGNVTVFEAEVRADWLDDLDGAVQQDSRDRPGVPEQVNGLTINGELRGVPTETGHDRPNGETYSRFVLDRRYMPTRTGTLRLGQPVLRFTVAQGRDRIGLFGERVAGRTTDLFAYGQPREVEVLPLPTDGRPETFAGGVGRFELESTVDRDSLQVGDSLKWTLRVTGAGNLEFLGLLEIRELAGFHVLGRNENRGDGFAEVTYDLTPLAVEANSLPAVEWAFFDTTPGVEAYRELRTEAVALRVAPLPEGASLASAGDADASKALTPGVDDIHDILTLEDLAASEAAPPAPSGGPSASTLLAVLLLPWLVVAGLTLFVWHLRRRRGDVAGRRARQAADQLRRGLAAGEPIDQLLADYLAARLGVAPAAVAGDPQLAQRLASAGCPAELGERAAQLLERAAAARYGSSATAPSRDELAQLLAALEAVSLRRVAVAGAAAVPAGALAVLLMGSVSAAPVAAGDPPQEPVQAADAERAYRSGEHELAAQLWRARIEQSGAERPGGGDARLYYNLGNALYRSQQPAAALWAWESARQALPRDARLSANVALVERQLGVGGAMARDESFFDAVGELRAALRPGEFLMLCAGLQVLAAGLFALAWLRSRSASSRRGVGLLRALGVLVVLPAFLFAAELVWFGPARLPHAIVLDGPRLPVRAEPGAELAPVAELAPGLRVAVRGRGEDWTRVQLPNREGYVATERLGFLPAISGSR